MKSLIRVGACLAAAGIMWFEGQYLGREPGLGFAFALGMVMTAVLS